jgi:hypothetical protein
MSEFMVPSSVKINPIGTSSSASSSSVEVTNFPSNQLVSLSIPTTIATYSVKITATAQIVATDATTKEVSIINTSDTDTLYVGASGVSTSTGIPVLPFSSVTLKTTAAIHGVSNGGEIDVRYIKYS